MAIIKHVKSDADTNKTITSIVRPQDWNSNHAITMLEGVSLYTGAGSGNNVGASNITSGNVHIVPSNYVFFTSTQVQNEFGNVYNFRIFYGSQMSSYENISAPDLDPFAMPSGSTSQLASFQMANDANFQIVKFLVSLSANSTTLVPGNTQDVFNTLYTLAMNTTFDIGIYTIDYANSLLSLSASKRPTLRFGHSVSISNVGGRNASQVHSQELYYLDINTPPQETSTSTSYTTNDRTYYYSSNLMSLATNMRWIVGDVPQLTGAGAYFLLVGMTTSSTSAASDIAPASVCAPFIRSIYGATALNNNVAVMGINNNTNGFIMGAGSFSSNARLPNSIPFSQISSNPSHVRFYFVMEEANAQILA